MGKWLFVFAHMDDETLCAYDLIKRHDSAIMILTKGFNPNYSYGDRTEVFHSLWASNQTRVLDYEDETLDKVSQASIADRIKDFMLEVKPEVVVTHYSGDLHYEHQLCSRCTKVAARRIESIKTIYEAFNSESTLYPEHQFNVLHSLDLDGIAGKVEAIGRYQKLGYKFTAPVLDERLRVVRAFV